MNLIGREEREKLAYDEGNIPEKISDWHSRFPHVFESANTLRKERLFDELIRTNARGKKVLEIGCGSGITAEKVLSWGAAYVYGIDISEKEISEAKKLEKKGGLEFECKSASDLIEGQFDLIIGRAILHHINYQEVIMRLYKRNLKEKGAMLFMEPLGANIFLKLYWIIAKSAHTQDEKPFLFDDLRWLNQHFTDIHLYFFNFFSFMFGILSSMLFSSADNFLLRLCDRVDVFLEQRVKFLRPYFRYLIICIRK